MTILTFLAGPILGGDAIIPFTSGIDPYAINEHGGGNSTLSISESNGWLQWSGSAMVDTAPNADISTPVFLTCEHDWLLETRVRVSTNLFSRMTERDSIQIWLRVRNSEDTNDSVYVKVGNIRGGFEFGGQPVPDSYFVSSGYEWDDDNISQSGTSTEWRHDVDLLGGVELGQYFIIRMRYDSQNDLLTGQHQIGDDEWLSYVHKDNGSSVDLHPLTQWQLQTATPLEVSMTIAAIRGATGSGEPDTLSGSFDILSNEVGFDHLLIEHTESNWVNPFLWLSGLGQPFENSTDPSVIGLGKDPDKDGLSNIGEFWFGRLSSSEERLPNEDDQQSPIDLEISESEILITHLRRRSPLNKLLESIKDRVELGTGGWQTAQPTTSSVNYVNPIFERVESRFSNSQLNKFYLFSLESDD